MVSRSPPASRRFWLALPKASPSSACLDILFRHLSSSICLVRPCCAFSVVKRVTRDGFCIRAAAARAVLAQNVASKPGREDYVRVRLSQDGDRILATPMPGKSGAIFNLISADGLVKVPSSSEGLDEGTEVDVIQF